MAIDPTSLTLDVIARTETAATAVAHLAVGTRMTFTVDDIVEAVERGLPVFYPVPSADGATRRDVIVQIAGTS
ncbi:hypothetical protein GCM10023205_04040 [Yinghuangia aomiensis]|uniref:Uncharacterized protein n=1 Tax=Yinghuangia aomiensis TaxID=676205 RepID=A0ABP9GMP0_9ACTN